MLDEVVLQSVMGVTLVTALAWAINVAGRRTAAPLRSALWRTALPAFWLVPAVALIGRAMHVRTYTVTVPLSAEWRGAPVPPAPSTGMPQGQPAPTPSGRSGPGPSDAAPVARVPSLSPAAAALTIWAAGALLGLLLLARNVYGVHRLVRSAAAIGDPDLEARAVRWSGKVGLRSAPRLVESPRVTGPTLAGVRRPAMLLPLDRTPMSGDLDAVMIHELAHISRHDLAVQAVARLTRGIWWWHPLAWLMVHQLTLSAEEACDDWAVSLTGDRRMYAAAVVKWAEAAGPAGPLRCAYSGRPLARRVERILARAPLPAVQVPRRLLVALALCGLAVMVAAGTVRVRVAAQPVEKGPANGGGVTVTIAGTVLGPEDQPLVGCQVHAIAWNGEWITEQTRSNADGQFSFTYKVKEPARYAGQIAAVKEGFALGWALGPGGGGEVTLRLSAPAQTCAGTVTDPAGKPIRGAEVWAAGIARLKNGEANEGILVGGLPGLPTTPLTALLTSTTGRGGRFEVGYLPAGTVVGLMATAEGYELLPVGLYGGGVPAGRQDVRIVLHPEATISGRVTHNGQPMGGVKVGCRAERPASGYGEGVSAADGTYSVGRLGEAIYYVAPLSLPEGYWARPISRLPLAAGQQLTGVDFGLVPTETVEGSVTNAKTGQPVPGAIVFAYHGEEAGRPVFAGKCETDSSGHYVLHLPVGANRLRCEGRRRDDPSRQAAEQEREVAVVRGQRLTAVDFAVPPAPRPQGSAAPQPPAADALPSGERGIH